MVDSGFVLVQRYLEKVFRPAHDVLKRKLSTDYFYDTRVLYTILFTDTIFVLSFQLLTTQS